MRWRGREGGSPPLCRARAGVPRAFVFLFRRLDTGSRDDRWSCEADFKVRRHKFAWRSPARALQDGRSRLRRSGGGGGGRWRRRWTGPRCGDGRGSRPAERAVERHGRMWLIGPVSGQNLLRRLRPTQVAKTNQRTESAMARRVTELGTSPARAGSSRHRDDGAGC